MNIFVKEYPDCLRQAFVKVGPVEIGEEYTVALTSVQREATLAGYRKGKAPLELIEKQNSQEVMEAVVGSLVRKAAAQLQSEGTVFYTDPKFTPLTGLSKTQDFGFALVFEIAPKVIKPIDFDKLKVTADDYIVDSKMVDYSVSQRLEILEEVSGKIEKGDTVTATIENADYLPEAKTKVFDAGVLEILIGHKKGESIEIDFADLGSYLVEYLGAVESPLQLSITKVERPSLSKADDETVAQMTPFGTLAEFKDAVKDNLEQMASQLSGNKKREALARAIADKGEFEFPKSLYIEKARYDHSVFMDEHVNLIDKNLTEVLADKKMKELFSSKLSESYAEIAFILILDDFAANESIQADENYVNAILSQQARENEMSLDAYKSRISNEDLQSTYREARREAAVSALMDKVKFEVGEKLPLIPER